MEKDKFVIEVSNGEKIKSLLVLSISLFAIIVSGALLMMLRAPVVAHLPFLRYLLDYIQTNIGNFTIAGVFYSSFLAGIFFVPSPDEVLFYYAISKNGLIVYTLFAVLAGYMLAQLLNYYLGWKASDYILNFVSKRKLYQGRRYINKYGSIGIFLFNFLPFPAPLLSLGLGIAKYNLKRLMIWSFLGHLLKFLVVIGAYLVLGQI